MRVIVLVDGEHYPPVTRWGIDLARERGLEPVAALMLGGTEKLRPGEDPDLGVPLRRAGGSARDALATALDELDVLGVLDLSDEPVVGYRERLELASVALARGLAYLGPDVRLDPPVDGPMLEVPTVAVFGVGKRTGKTAIAGEVARIAARADLDPVVVAMGRGGPPQPQVAPAGSVGIERLLELVRGGEHAASDYLEHAVTTGVTTVGARRVGGGLGGRPYATNVREAAEVAAGLGGLVVMDGSGAALPSVPWDAGVLVVPAGLPPEYLGGYLGPLRLLLSDLVVVTMGRSPAGLENLPILRSHVERLRGDARLIVTDFEPMPLGDVRGRDVFFTTTASRATAEQQSKALESVHGCRVVGWSARLADRAGLAQDLDGAEAYEVLLTELKAAAVDVACDRALAKGAEVLFVDNRAVVVEGEADLSSALMETIGLAGERRTRR
ncbi:MAG TPA: cyclic 2,3-diphosphoglycerate synthetase [Actinomycetota bacterium]|nr:cyclic 2,3-diphosphoglycerate synthetase [Actinomycetota bacterium]